MGRAQIFDCNSEQFLPPSQFIGSQAVFEIKILYNIYYVFLSTVVPMMLCTVDSAEYIISNSVVNNNNNNNNNNKQMF